MESVRLNNLVITTFRTLSEDFSFDEKYSFKKGTQFLILNNPVLREKEYFEKPNEFIPERWTEEMEQSYYALSFGQGPQRCPGKELAIYLCQSFIYNFFRIKNINKDTIIQTNKLNTTNIPQIINPFNSLRFFFKKSMIVFICSRMIFNSIHNIAHFINIIRYSLFEINTWMVYNIN